MGGFFAGLGSAVGGAGQAATQYGHQIRQILESRRDHLADLLTQAATSTADPNARGGLYGLISDLHSGKEMGDITARFAKIVQTHAADHQKLLSVFPPPEQKQTPTSPGAPGPGQTPGTHNPVPIQPLGVGEAPTGEANARTGNGEMPLPVPALPAPMPAAASAAQPATNPTQGGPIAPVQPQAPSPGTGEAGLYPAGSQGADILAQLNTMRGAIGGPPGWLANLAQPYQAAEAGFGEKKGIREANIRNLNEYLKTPGSANIPDIMKEMSAMQTYTGSAPMSMGMGLMLRTHDRAVDATTMTPEQKVLHGIPSDATGPWKVPVNYQGIPTGEAASPAFAGYGTAPMAGGQAGIYSKANPAAGVQPLPGAMAPSTAEKKSSSQIQEGGATTHVQSVVPPASVGGQAKPKATGSAAPGESRSRLNSVVATLLTPNMSEGQYNTTYKALVQDKTPFAKEVRQEMARRTAADPGPIAWDIGTAERAQLSAQTLTHIATINKLVDTLDAKGQLGPVMSRWNEFWAGNIGKDLSGNADYVKLKNQIGLLTKIMGRIHGGARGGGSIQMIENFKHDLTQEHMDAQTLKGALSVEQEWLESYANPKATTRINPVSGGAGAGAKPSLDEIFK